MYNKILKIIFAHFFVKLEKIKFKKQENIIEVKSEARVNKLNLFSRKIVCV